VIVHTSLFSQQAFAMNDTELMRGDPESEAKLCQQVKALRSMITGVLFLYVLFLPATKHSVSLT